MKVEDNPIHSMILQNDAEGVKALLNDSSVDFKVKNERGNVKFPGKTAAVVSVFVALPSWCLIQKFD